MASQNGIARGLLCALLLVVGIASPLSSQEAPAEYSPLAFSGKTGEFAYYRDTRGESVAYIGLCVMGRNKLAIRLWEPDSGNELIVLETFFTTGDKYVEGGLTAEEGTIDLIRGDFSKGRSASVLSEVLSWADAWVKARPLSGSVFEFAGGASAEFVFQSRVPVIQLRGTPSDASGKSLALVRTGVLSSGSDPSFYGWKGEDADASVLPEVAAD
jgi:hypothetical protein